MDLHTWRLVKRLGHHKGTTVAVSGEREAGLLHPAPAAGLPRRIVALAAVFMPHAARGAHPKVVGARDVCRDGGDGVLLQLGDPGPRRDAWLRRRKLPESGGRKEELSRHARSEVGENEPGCSSLGEESSCALGGSDPISSDCSDGLLARMKPIGETEGDADRDEGSDSVDDAWDPPAKEGQLVALGGKDVLAVSHHAKDSLHRPEVRTMRVRLMPPAPLVGDKVDGGGAVVVLELSEQTHLHQLVVWP
eukprot:scaffold48521_cov29-Tisochrysis_lutea.AAC.2